MAKKINELTGIPSGIREAPVRVWDTKIRLLASIDRAREILGYTPQMNFDEGLQNTFHWFKENWDKIVRDAEFPPGLSSAVQGMVIGKK